MTLAHTVTFAGLVGNLVGFVLFYKASAASQRFGDSPRLRSMNHWAFALVMGGFGLQFLGAGMFMPR